MRTLIARLLMLACVALAVVPTTASAAKRPAKPKVTSVSPLSAKLGDKLTIRGSGFLRGRNKTTVVLKRDGARAVFLKAERATSTKLTVTLSPKKLSGFITGGPVRFRVRVLARRLSESYTPAAKSPRIAADEDAPTAKKSAATSAASATAATAPADCDGDGTPNAADGDDDNDLLPDALEAQLGTTACAADSDGDGMEDGWEYQTARDLNAGSCPATPATADPVVCNAAKPYPRSRPYTNPLDADAHKDLDGDYLPAWWEHAAWKKHGVRSLDDLWYSDGEQASRDSSAADGCSGLTEATITGHLDQYPSGQVAHPPAGTATTRWAWLYQNAEYTLDANGSGCVSDRERDEDGDFLSNGQELVMMMSGPDYVKALYEEPSFKTIWAGTDPLDPDVDGDGVVDGLDDQDYDDFWNVEEIVRGRKSWNDASTGILTGLWVDPYNPCLPATRSRSCPVDLLIGAAAWMPFMGPTDTAPTDRWPLYNREEYTGELWDGAPQAQQRIPLEEPGNAATNVEHPLSPRPF